MWLDLRAAVPARGAGRRPVAVQPVARGRGEQAETGRVVSQGLPRGQSLQRDLVGIGGLKALQFQLAHPDQRDVNRLVRPPHPPA